VIVGTGLDLCEVARVRRMVARWGDRFLERVFTPGEIAYARRHLDPAEPLAARFAAKEAALKALGSGLSLGVRWREVEVRREEGGRPTLALSGRAAALGRARGVARLHLSLTHEAGLALAQVLAEDA
jgi:holo-[acyl-carrier protein] synthase